MTAPAPIDFWFDFTSPYSYVASAWIDDLAARHGRAVRRHAILLGATMQAAELKAPTAHPIKRDYALRDFARSARFVGLPYRPPARFPIGTQNAARVFWWLHDGGAPGAGPQTAAAWARAGLAAYFAEGVDLSEPSALRALLAREGLDADAAEAAWGDAHWKARLKQANDDAIARGVFGAPYFVVDGEPFWGQDRRPQIERWLAEGPF